MPSVAAEGWVHGAWREAVIDSPSSTAVSMKGIERVAVIQSGSPQGALPTRGRMCAARKVELTLSTHSCHSHLTVDATSGRSSTSAEIDSLTSGRMGISNSVEARS